MGCKWTHSLWKRKTTLMTASFPCNYVNSSFRSFICWHRNEWTEANLTMFSAIFDTLNTSTEITFLHIGIGIKFKKKERKKEVSNLFLLKINPTFFHVLYQLYVFVSVRLRMFVYSFAYTSMPNPFIRGCRIRVIQAKHTNKWLSFTCKWHYHLEEN